MKNIPVIITLQKMLYVPDKSSKIRCNSTFCSSDYAMDTESGVSDTEASVSSTDKTVTYP